MEIRSQMSALTLVHVLFGTVALAMVPAALLVRKGGVWHRRFGVAFTMAMAVVLLSAGFLWQAKGHLFLVPLAAVSAYLIFAGWRTLARRRRRSRDEIEDRTDMLAACAAILAGAATAYIGITAGTPLLISIRSALIGIGSIAICFALNEILGFQTARTKSGWLLAHLSAMLAAYISAVTAFLVINAHHVPMTVRWLVPSALGAATIVGYSTWILMPAWRAKFARAAHPANARFTKRMPDVRYL
jgi:uncharacterized membrane protein